MDIQNLSIDSITPYYRNPRKNAKSVPQVARSLKEFGWRQPIVVDKDMVIVIGHTRRLAAIDLGMTEVPVHIAKDLSPEKAKALRIMDNKSSENSEWDHELLRFELTELAELKIDMDMTGFDLEFLGTIIMDANPVHENISSRETEEIRSEIIGSDDRKISEGAVEYHAEEFDKFKHACPKCGFEFDNGLLVRKGIENGISSENGSVEPE